MRGVNRNLGVNAPPSTPPKWAFGYRSIEGVEDLLQAPSKHQLIPWLNSLDIVPKALLGFTHHTSARDADAWCFLLLLKSRQFCPL